MGLVAHWPRKWERGNCATVRLGRRLIIEASLEV